MIARESCAVLQKFPKNQEKQGFQCFACCAGITLVFPHFATYTHQRRRGRVVEGTPLLRAQTSKGSRGFESLRLRHKILILHDFSECAGISPRFRGLGGRFSDGDAPIPLKSLQIPLASPQAARPVRFARAQRTGNYQGILVFHVQFGDFPPGIIARFPWVTTKFPAPQEQGI